MKAAICREFRAPLRLEDVVLAPPEADSVLVRIAACAICHSDIIYIDGGWGGALPTVFGHEASGIVEQVGPSVSGLAPGDRVVITMVRSCGECPCCVVGLRGSCEADFPLSHRSPLTDVSGAPIGHGMKTAAFAERTVVHRSQLVKVDNDVPFGIASLLACGVITGYGAVMNTARVHPGADAVVIGTGGVGLNSVQAAALSGARRVIAVDIADEKLAAAEQFGATHRIRAGADLGRTVREITSGRGVDFVFVTVGAKAAIDSCLELLAPGGAAVLVGIPASGVLSNYDPGALAGASQRILGSKMGASDIQADIPRLIELYRAEKLQLDELISGTFAFEDINAALDTARGGRGLRTVVTFGGIAA